MTRNAKIIIGVVAGVVLIGVFIFVAAFAVIALSVMSVQTNETSSVKKSSAATPAGRNAKNKSKSADEIFPEDSGSDEDAAAVSGTLAPKLVGTWHRSEGSGHIDYTGKTQYKSGVDYTYELAANGAVKYSMEADTLSILQCKIQESETAFGTAASDDETLTISLNKTAHTKSNSCESSEDVDETLPAKTVELKYQLKTEYDVTRLCIEEEKGEFCYDRKD